MQIHEIFRSRTNEGILKGVRTLPPRNDRGRFMPRAATAAFNQMATQLQNQPAAPASLPTATTPAPGSTPAYGQRLSGYGQQNYNVPTGVQLPAQAAPAAGTTTQPEAKPTATASATAPSATPGKAGFFRNAAEYFANKTMNAAGIPIDQQGEYHPGGHMAALQGKGLSAIQQAEASIVKQLSDEYAQQGTLNRKLVPFNRSSIKNAASLINDAGPRLQINLDQVAKQVIQATRQKRTLIAQRAAATAAKPAAAPQPTTAPAAAPATQPTTTPAASTMRGNKPGAPTQQDYANLEKKLQQAMAAQGQPA